MWDQKTGRSRGFGFVSFRSQQVYLFSFYLNHLSNDIFLDLAESSGYLVQDAQSAINDLTGENILELISLKSSNYVS